MFYTIYQITHTATGRHYIGKHQTENLNDDYMGSGKILRRAIKKHGITAFTKSILHVYNTEEEMNAKERELVTEDFCRRKDTYNICEGGKGGFGYINRNEPLRVRKNRKARMTTNKILAKRYGASWNRIISRRGGLERYHKHGVSQKWLDAGRTSFLGRQHTSETKEKMSRMRKTNPLIGQKNGRYGTMWITNGVDNQVIRHNLPIPDGWRKGRVHGN